MRIWIKTNKRINFMGDLSNIKIGYLAAMSERPISHSGYPELENLVFDWRPMPITDARNVPGGATLRSHGFTAVPHETEIRTFDESDSWHRQFALEVKQIVMKLTGAAEVVVPDYAVSIRSTAFNGSQSAAHFCHNDYTPGSAARHITSLDPAKAERRLNKRFAAYNLWRLISPPPQNQPLALCDSRSVAVGDFIPGEARYGNAEQTGVWGEIACFRYNPSHRWHYYSDLGNDEILIWSGYDSNPEFPSIVPHTAIVNPDCPMDAPPRMNAECRCYAFFD
jgi:hypothetical protein